MKDHRATTAQRAQRLLLVVLGLGLGACTQQDAARTDVSEAAEPGLGGASSAPGSLAEAGNEGTASSASADAGTSASDTTGSVDRGSDRYGDGGVDRTEVGVDSDDEASGVRDGSTPSATESAADGNPQPGSAQSDNTEADNTQPDDSEPDDSEPDDTQPGSTPPPDATEPSDGESGASGGASTPGEDVVTCGNGERSELESCDDGNRLDGDGCAADCSSIEAHHSCPWLGGPCLPIARCGDGSIAPSEQCDDGNRATGDGCSATCAIEPGFGCRSQPSACAPADCGNSVQEGAEGCDDGNVMAGDGCSATCERECLVEPCPSQACGDGAVETEECDDANSTSGDGCSSSCTIEPGFVCELSEVGSVCTPVCGDGLLAAGEECDDGINDGGHGECAPGCVLGAYCGDGVVNGPEQCDAGDVAELRSCAVCPGPSSLP